MKRLLQFSLMWVASGAFAQNVVVKKVELAGDKIIVHYELDDSNPNHEYQLSLFSSVDNFGAPLKKVTGDVGDEIKPGVNKKMEWNIREEMGSYHGRISLEVRGKVYLPFVKLQNFDVNKNYKRGKSHDITWKPGNTNPISIELFQGGKRISGEVNHPNNGSYSLFIPANVKPGKDYRLKITDTKNSSEVIFSPYFKVVPKVPLVVKLLPIAVIGGVIAVLAGKKPASDDGGGGDQTTNIELPALPN